MFLDFNAIMMFMPTGYLLAAFWDLVLDCDSQYTQKVMDTRFLVKMLLTPLIFTFFEILMLFLCWPDHHW
jgi:hypothetical protein